MTQREPQLERESLSKVPLIREISAFADNPRDEYIFAEVPDLTHLP
jgi:hypothetical protein